MQIANHLGKQENSELELTYRQRLYNSSMSYVNWYNKALRKMLFLWESKMPDSTLAGMSCIELGQFLELQFFLNTDMKPWNYYPIYILPRRRILSNNIFCRDLIFLSPPTTKDVILRCKSILHQFQGDFL